jgi:hypothetical protein
MTELTRTRQPSRWPEDRRRRSGIIISRRNEPTIAFHHSTPNAESLPSVRNGNRWRVAGIDTKRNLLGAERLDDGARVLFDRDYFREHVGLGYAVTVHSAQGVTADASLAVLSDTTSRNLIYVAMTRGRHANHAHIYERSTEASEFSQEEPAGTHIAQRGDSQEAATIVYGILANDALALTAYNYAAQTPDQVLPDRVRDLLSVRATATQERNVGYQTWKTERQEHDRSRAEAPERHIERSQHRSADNGLEL